MTVVASVAVVVMAMILMTMPRVARRGEWGEEEEEEGKGGGKEKKTQEQKAAEEAAAEEEEEEGGRGQLLYGNSIELTIATLSSQRCSWRSCGRS
jgi:hypothetical protein